MTDPLNLVPPGSMYCRTCRYALNAFVPEGSGVLTWKHQEEVRGQTVDHPADPIPLSALPDAIQRCDFCSVVPAAFVYRAGNQVSRHNFHTRVVGSQDHADRAYAARTIRHEKDGHQTQNWGENWTACQPCGALVEAGDLLGLIRRATEQMDAKLTNTTKKLLRVRGYLDEHFSEFLRTRHAGRGAISYGHPLGVWEPEDGCE